MSVNLRVSSIMTHNPVILKPDSTVRDAALLMVQKDVGGVIILGEGGKLEGMVTEGDIVRKVTAVGADAANTRASEIMSRELVTLLPDDTVEAAVERMAKARVRRLPVIEEGKVKGIVTYKDIIKISPGILDLFREWLNVRGYNKGEDDKDKSDIFFQEEDV